MVTMTMVVTVTVKGENVSFAYTYIYGFVFDIIRFLGSLPESATREEGIVGEDLQLYNLR